MSQPLPFVRKSLFGDFGRARADAAGAGPSRRDGLRRRLVLCRIDELERQIDGEFGVEALAPLLAELASLKAGLE